MKNHQHPTAVLHKGMGRALYDGLYHYKLARQLLYLSIMLLSSVDLFGQTSYSGFIGTNPIELVTDIFSDGDARAIYANSIIDEPIVINGELKQGKLTLFEEDSSGKITATLTFNNYNPANYQLTGIWNEKKSDNQLPITLTKNFDIDFGEGHEWEQREIIQSVSLNNTYFKLVISKSKDDYYAKVSGVKIFEKKTDKLMQQLEVDCQLWGLNNINIGDFNFDGVTDFSVFEQSYTGPNTSSLYFLFNPLTGKYFNSSFEGTSLEFDQEKKRIYEHNQCCAGRSHMNSEYEVINNEMVLVKRTCFEWDEKIDDLTEVQCD